METTKQKVHAVLDPAIRADPTVLQMQVEGAVSLTDRQTLDAAIRILGSYHDALYLLAQEIDDLRSTTNGGENDADAN